MDSRTAFEAALSTYHPRWLDGSKRGSGMNATWRIRLGDSSAILKTYDSRRGPVQSILTQIGNRMSGLTSYDPESRCRTERECLLLWHEAGFQVPKLVSFKPGIPLPTPFVAMEEVHGRLLLDVLADTSIEMEQRASLLRRFVVEWGRRHAAAVRSGDRRLVQKHGTFAHVFVDGDRFVTFDLEVAHCGRRPIPVCVGKEIICYLRSLVRRFQPGEADAWIRLVAASYPDKVLLADAATNLLNNSNLFLRAMHAIARRLQSAWKPRGGKYEVARRLAAALQS
jgi:tRNA A-37 threonylcarbamoyl transferase component Bud32